MRCHRPVLTETPCRWKRPSSACTKIAANSSTPKLSTRSTPCTTSSTRFARPVSSRSASPPADRSKPSSRIRPCRWVIGPAGHTNPPANPKSLLRLRFGGRRGRDARRRFRHWRALDQQRRDVVAAAAVEGGVDERAGGGLQVFAVFDDAGDVDVLQGAVEAVAAEKDDFVALQREFREMDLRLLADPQDVRQDVAYRVARDRGGVVPELLRQHRRGPRVVLRRRSRAPAAAPSRPTSR